jgi:O-antigen biosynthesis protein WbqV
VTFRQLIIVAHDLFMTALALVLSFFLRWGETEFWARADEIAIVCLVVTPLAGPGLLGLPLPSIALEIRLAAGPEQDRARGADPGDPSRGDRLPVARRNPDPAHHPGHLLAGPGVSPRRAEGRLPRLPQPRRERKAFEGVYRMPVLIAGAGYEAEQLIRRLQRDTAAPMEAVGL